MLGRRWEAEAGSVPLLALSLEGLLVEVSLDLLAEHQHAQVGMGGFIHGFGLDAHAVLLRGQLVRALLLVPQVKEAGHRRADHDQVAAEVLSVEVDVFHAPAFDFKIKSTCRGENRCVSVLREFNTEMADSLTAYQYLGNLSDTDKSSQSQNLSRSQHLFCESMLKKNKTKRNKKTHKT